MVSSGSELEPFDGNGSRTLAEQSGTVEGLVTQARSMQAAVQIAQALCGTSLVPKAYHNKPDDGAAAIMYGMELGLNAIQSLQNIQVINGKPSIEARTMVALLKRQGYRFETSDFSDECVTVVGHSPTGEREESTWTLERAKKAGLTRNRLYASIPAQMLYAKAASEVCRRLAPDVLLGIAYSKEELTLGFGEPEPAMSVKSEVVQQPQPQPAQPRQDLTPQHNGGNISAQKAMVRDALFSKQPVSTTPPPNAEPQAIANEIESAGSPEQLSALGGRVKAWTEEHPEDREAFLGLWQNKMNSFQQQEG